MNKILTLVLLLMSMNSFGQTRYLDSLFIAQKTDVDVVYGTADALSPPYLNENSTSPQDLLMDIYRPQGDVDMVRPCVVFIHGGAFLFGSKEDVNGVNLCHHFTELGYVTASISYRLGMNTFSAASSQRAVYRGVQDTKAAIRFLKENHATYGIDTTRIFAMGSSAGSIAAIHAAYMEEDERLDITATTTSPDLGCMSCSGNNFIHNDKPVAVGNLWGAIVDTNYIEAGDVPMISFHGTNDNIVSADMASPFGSPFFPALSGSNYITPRLENLGIATAYYKFYGQGHEPWGTLSETPYFDTIVDKTTLFFYNYLQNNPSNTIEQNSVFEAATIYPNPVSDILNVDLDVNKGGNSKIIILNAVGQVLYNEHRTIQDGENQFQINTSALRNGWYYMMIEVNGQQVSRMVKGFVVERK